MLVDLGVDDSGVVYSDTPTTLKSRVQVGSQQIVRLDREEIFNLHGELLAKVIQILSGVISNLDAIILSDYSKGFLSNSLIEGVISKAYERGVPVIADPKGINFERYRGVEFLTPNKIEAEQATGIKILDDYSLELALEALKNIQETDVSIITLGSEGIALSEGGKVQIFPALSSEVFDVTGAGDTFIATLSFAIAKGKSIIESCEIANYASGVVIGKHGCVTVDYKEIESIL
jgi:D-beta-D-heptose 7-phosphate kinase/D-beta-D-heptose 1-phosphate adenosyltransferase